MVRELCHARGSVGQTQFCRRVPGPLQSCYRGTRYQNTQYSIGSTHRAIGPTTVLIGSNPGAAPVPHGQITGHRRTENGLLAPRSLIRPRLGLMEYIPQYAAGIRRLPPMSEPMPMAEPSMASRAPSPPELPPHVYLSFHGLVVRPHRGLLHSKASIVCDVD